MTPKEMAIELYNKYFYIIPSSIDNDFSDSFALKSALICINEIIKSNPMQLDYPIYYSNINFYKEVKKELINL